MDFEVWAAFVAASFVVLLIPGPIVLMIVTHTLARGPRTALPLACGTILGDATMMTLSLLGVGTLLAASATMFTAFRWVGAAYLAWLGIGLWRAAAPGTSRAGGGAASDRWLVAHAFLVVTLNPLSVAFFMAFLPQFIDPAGDFWSQVLVLEATFLVLAFANTLFYALVGAWLGDAVTSPAAVRALHRVGGLALICIGLWLAAVAA